MQRRGPVSGPRPFLGSRSVNRSGLLARRRDGGGPKDTAAGELPSPVKRPSSTPRPFPVVFGIIAMFATGCAAPRSGPVASQTPIRVRCVERSLSDGTEARATIATIDLDHPRLRVEVSGPLVDAPPGVEATLETTPAWALVRDLDVAVNANFFAMVRPREPYVPGGQADVLGLCVSDGRLVSPPRTFGGQGDPALLLHGDGRASIRRVDAPPDSGVRHAVAGIGGSSSDPDRGSLLIEGGVDRSATARVEPLVRHPRTAAGVTQDGRRLVLVVVDGRRPGWSVGMTLPELAAFMLELGVHDAVNLDGGGSSTIVWRESPEGPWRTNRAPEARGFRPVSTSLGFRLER